MEKQRDSAMDALKVDIDEENGSICVWNNGAGETNQNKFPAIPNN
jgi:hypothetical protein